MRFGVRAKLFRTSILVVLAVVLGAGLFLQSELTRRLEARVESELVHHVASVREMLAAIGSPAFPHADTLAVRIGAATDTRVTIIRDDGTVIGDSELSRASLSALDDHSNRPEVVAARETGRGMANRYSTTLGTELLYVALPYDGGVVRVARPLGEIDAAVARLRRQLVIAGLLGLAIAILMTALASAWMARTLRNLATSAKAIARGDARERIVVPSSDELGHLAGSLNEIAEGIETTVATLAAERAQFATILEGMSEAVIAIDGDRMVSLVNPAAHALLGIKAAGIGKPLAELVRVPALHELVAEGTADASASAEFDLPGTGRRVLAKVAPQQAPSGGRVIVMLDISALRRLEAVRRDFVANVSHELRTPVSVVRANAETLLDGAIEDPVFANKLLAALHRNAERMSRLIADLLDLSRLEAGHYELDDEAVELADACERAVDSIERQASQHETELEIDVEPGVAVRGDAKAIDQVLINLIDNAVKYSPQGSRVRVAATPNGTRVRIEVEDDGPGIPPAARERVFERFYRVDPGRSRDMGGTGLGLSIVKHLVEAMRGSVGVRPVQPRGTVFWIDLPEHG